MTLALPVAWILFPILALLIYRPCLKGGLIYDDFDIAVRWRLPWARDSRPLTSGLYRLTELWPGTLRGHHTTTILLHSLNAILVGALASTLGLNGEIAGLVFLMHPFAVPAVAYISGMAQVLSTTFGLAALALVAAHHPGLSIPFLIAAVFAKQDGLCFTLTALLLAEWTGQHTVAYAGLATAVPAFLFVYSRFNVQAAETEINARRLQYGLSGAQPQPRHAFTFLIHTFCRLPAWFLGYRIAPYHGSNLQVSLGAGAIAGVGAIGMMGVMVLAPVPYLLVMSGPWLIRLLIPAHEPLQEYRFYGMTAGFALGLAMLPGGIVAAAILAWPFYTVPRLAAIFTSGADFWTHATENAEGDRSFAWSQLGNFFRLDNKPLQAEKPLRVALQINPRLGPAYLDLAWVLYNTGRHDEGLATLERGTRECQMYYSLWEDLALMYQLRNRLNPAYEAAAIAVRLAPHTASALNRLGVILSLQGNWARARDRFEAATLNGTSPSFRLNLALAERALGHDGKSEDILRTLPSNISLTTDLIPPQSTPQAVHG